MRFPRFQCLMLSLVSCAHHEHTYPVFGFASGPAATAPSGDPSMFDAGAFTNVDAPVQCTKGHWMIVVHGQGKRHWGAIADLAACRKSDAGASACPYVDLDALYADLPPTPIRASLDCGNRARLCLALFGWQNAQSIVANVVAKLATWDLAEDVAVYIEPPLPPATLL